jgi:tetratricopeptide (TPR) repeat protein
LIDQIEALDTIIDELIATSFRFPVEPSIWETLGDAYLQSGQIQNALGCYSKAEELLRLISAAKNSKFILLSFHWYT